jgi:hypothetical protein
VGSLLQRPGVRLTLAAFAAGAWLCAAVALAATPARTRLMTYITGLSTSPQVWVANLNGSSPFDLGPASSALISPNGSYVAAVSKGQTNKASTLSVYATGGGAAAVVVESPQIMQLPVGAWSSDSKLILVVVGASPADLDVVDVATGKSRTIATGVIYGASFSPGSSDNVVYARGAPNKTPVNLYTTTSTGAGTRQLTHDGASVEPLWGAHGIVYSDESAHAKTHTAQLQLWLINPDGSGARQLTNIAIKSGWEGLTPIAISADGEHVLANLVGPPGSNDTEAYTVDLSAKKPPRDLTGQGSGYIGDAISSDGNWVLLTKGTANNLASFSVELVKWPGGKPTTLVKQGAYASWDR